MKQYIPLKSPALLGRLTALLDLSTLNSPPAMELWPGILPVLNLEGVLGVPSVGAVTIDLDVTPAGTAVICFTVRAKKRWRLTTAYRSAITSGYGRIGITDGVSYVPLTIGGTTGEAAQLFRPYGALVLLAGWSIYVESTDDAGDTARTLNIAYVEEDTYGL